MILTVDNRTRDPLLISLESKSRTDSLGAVPRGTTRSFSMPSSAGDSAAMFYLAARAGAATAAVRSRGFQPSPGEQVVWTIEPTRTMVTTR